MKKSLTILLKSFHANGIRLTINKIFIKKMGKIVLDAQKSAKFIEQKNLISAIDINASILRNNFNLINSLENKSANVKIVNWLLPNFEHVLYGGIYTILRMASYFQKNGIKNRIIIYDNPYADIEKIKNTVKNEFSFLRDAEFIALNEKNDDLPESDAVISTFWTSCFLNVRSNRTKKKFYFIQDYEPLFYSANSYYALAEATYRFGFNGIVNTPGLADFVREQHGMSCKDFYPCIDEKIFNINEEQLNLKFNKDVIDIFVYGRPNHDRNAFELAIIALTKLKNKYGDRINIYSAGDDWNEKDYGVDGIIKNLGRLNSLNDVADLYRKCDIGLVFMFTKHPSYQPFEYMSCGCAVVTNYNKSNIWFLKDEKNCLLSEPMPGCIFDKVSILIDSIDIRKKIVSNGLIEVKKHSWDNECEKIYKYVIGK